MSDRLKPNSLLKHDDLFWNKMEGKFVALSNKEIDKILIACCHSGMEDVDEMHTVVQWATYIKVGRLLLRGLMSGRLGVGVHDGEPEFFEVQETKPEPEGA